MSADNMILVRQRSDGLWAVSMEFASCEPKPVDQINHTFPTRAAALEAAADWYTKEDIVEYGIVIEPSP